MDPLIEAFLADAAKRAPGDEVLITIRNFISRWDAQRRGYWVVAAIQRDLAAYNLVTVPSFETGWIDNSIRLVRVPTVQPETDTPETEATNLSSSLLAEPVGVRVSALASASGGITAIAREDSLARAQSLMLQNDYSQLPVIAGTRQLQGAVSWESIAKTRMHHVEFGLRDCTVPAEAVTLDDDLLAHIPRIIDRGYVFVRDPSGVICGLVTTADLSLTFETLTGPFLLIGEIERRVRAIVGSVFSIEQIESARHPGDEQREVRGAADLSLGELTRLFESKERWNQLGWDVDRTVFVESLHELRGLRNEVMHFSPDPVDPASLAKLRNLLKWLKLVVS